MGRLLTIALLLVLALTACTEDSALTPSNEAVTTLTTVTESGTTAPGSSATTTTPAPPVTEPDLSGVEGISESARQQLEELIIEAQEVRGLPFLTSPNITVVSNAELERRVREAIEDEAADFPADEALYRLLGLLSADADLESLLLALYGEQVAGFYDGETGEIVVPSNQEGLSVLQRGTMIHELVHALTDQHFGFDGTFQEMLDQERLDEATAYQALIEGDATLAEVMWLRALSQGELGEFIAESLDVDTGALDSVPQFISDSLIFPYDSGLVFVQELYGAGGWEAINDAYSTLPVLPGSTEQIIAPDDYGRDLPTVVEIPSITLTGYELERTSVWGEEAFRTMFDQVFTESASAKAADGWGGDAYHQWFDGENAAFLLVYESDTARDLEEMRQTLLDFARGTVPEEDFVWVDEEDGLLYFIAADVVEVGEFIRDTLGLT